MKQILNIQESLKLYSSQKLYHFSLVVADILNPNSPLREGLGFI